MHPLHRNKKILTIRLSIKQTQASQHPFNFLYNFRGIPTINNTFRIYRDITEKLYIFASAWWNSFGTRKWTLQSLTLMLIPLIIVTANILPWLKKSVQEFLVGSLCWPRCINLLEKQYHQLSLSISRTVVQKAINVPDIKFSQNYNFNNGPLWLQWHCWEKCKLWI